MARRIPERYTGVDYSRKLREWKERQRQMRYEAMVVSGIDQPMVSNAQVEAYARGMKTTDVIESGDMDSYSFLCLPGGTVQVASDRRRANFVSWLDAQPVGILRWCSFEYGGPGLPKFTGYDGIPRNVKVDNGGT